MKKLFTLLLLCALLAGCGQSKMAVTHSSSSLIPVTNAADANADTQYAAYLQPIKDKIDKEMNIVIGYAPEALTAGKSTLENPLSNYCTDVYRKASSEYLKQPIDIAIANYGGFRSSIPAGDVTVGTVFQLLPFENELVILWLRGDKLDELLQFFASTGGESELGVTFVISNKQAVDIKVNGESLDKNRLYRIATNDYCAGGNDKMFALAEYEKRINTGIKLRNMLIDYIKKETANGNQVHAELDGRIRFAD
ncbi:MAG: 5'-nucleotidase C-terminal domain-containing protein [Paludibacter sp.]|jgi:2',3'-cyclic-nucleotide 2'-phosphodiesterase (5'-nucleotidase family)|nr:5'-nucleotidase C-terminal domain-containing protein [Paludibacter sp.]